VNILETGTPDQLRERAFKALDHAQRRRRMAARLIAGAEASESEAARYAVLADEREQQK
jgi:hypothetical protein